MAEEQRDTGRLSWPWQVFAVSGGPFAWTAHLAVGYLLITIDCMTGLAGIRLWLLAVAGVALAIDVASGLVSYRIYREPPATEDTEAEGPPGWLRFTGVAGIVFSLVFAFAIILGATSSLLLTPCGDA